MTKDKAHEALRRRRAVVGAIIRKDNRLGQALVAEIARRPDGRDERGDLLQSESASTAACAKERELWAAFDPTETATD